MSDPILVALIAAVPAALSATAAVLALRNHDSIKEMKVSLDGRLDKLLSGAVAQGRQDERDEVRRDAEASEPKE